MDLVFLSFLIFLMMGYAAYHDLQTMRIPNWISLAIIGVYGFRAVVSPETVFLLMDFLGMIAVLFVGFILYYFKWYGAGDIKLWTAGSLWFGSAIVPHYGMMPGFPLFVEFLLISMIFGGLQAVIHVFIRSDSPLVIPLQVWIPSLQKKTHIAYGLSISLGAFWALYIQFRIWGIL